MADFVDDFPDDVLLDILGDSVTHVTQSAVVTVTKAVMEFDVEVDEFNSEQQTQVELLKSDFASPLQRGDNIIHNGKTYNLDSRVVDQQTDGRFERWGLIDA